MVGDKGDKGENGTMGQKGQKGELGMKGDMGDQGKSHDISQIDLSRVPVPISSTLSYFTPVWLLALSHLYIYVWTTTCDTQQCSTHT